MARYRVTMRGGGIKDVEADAVQAEEGRLTFLVGGNPVAMFSACAWDSWVADAPEPARKGSAQTHEVEGFTPTHPLDDA